MSRKKIDPILGQVSVAYKIGFYSLVLLFCVLMGLLISDNRTFDPGTIAAAGIFIYFLTLFIIAYIRKSMIKKLDQTNDQMKIMSTTDELTRSFNRKHFNILFEKELYRVKRYETNLGCLMLDIDHFKKINSKYGHEVGDEMLQDISDLIKDNLRITDIHARYGDNRFICLLPEIDFSHTLDFSKRLRRILEGKKIIYRDTNEVINITVSIGITSCKPYKDKDMDCNKIISMAEKALEMAKKSGGNRVECFPQDLMTTLVIEKQISG